MNRISISDALDTFYRSSNNFRFLVLCIFAVLHICAFVHLAFGEDIEITNSFFKIRFDPHKGGITSVK